ncbi:FixH family protein [Sedimentitalea nanhaiensis]|uniref:Nitrogen fixation protein FixH n=1 Tax=Sedimentitalea nanhaiensis TaxID=999627 RepID=A0A1I6XF09_9RHOB|nr:FixH family protein [Sedimentitalea nanhaiensis]SFT36915.1 Nitrogen fixation protein FixH [Sedimentitalea nanhaiensis]
MAQREFTGRHAAALFIGAFGVIISVNLVLAYSAVQTFPGLEVENSYVASQEFNTRLQQQQALGWTVWAEARDGQVILSITDPDGAPVEVAKLSAVLGRATQVKDDISPEFVFDGSAYVAPVDLAAGNWNIRLVAQADDGTEFTQRVVLHVRG